jgi:sulfur-carrier protein
MIRVELPQHLRTLARVEGQEVTVEVTGPVTIRSILDAVEARYPTLRGTIRDQVTLERRPFLRFFACSEDLSHQSPDAPLFEEVADGSEPFMVIGAIAGGQDGKACDLEDLSRDPVGWQRTSGASPSAQG